MSAVAKGRLFVLGAMALCSVLACTPGRVERKWSEDVALDDGRVLAVRRQVTFQESHAFGGGAYSSIDIEASLSFQGELAGIPAWSFPVTPLVLYHDAATNQWVIVATMHTCEYWYSHQMPTPPYWEFRLVAGKWQAVPLSNSSLEKKTNLFTLYELELPASHIDLAMKARVLKTELIESRFRQVSASATTHCTPPTRH